MFGDSHIIQSYCYLHILKLGTLNHFVTQVDSLSKTSTETVQKLSLSVTRRGSADNVSSSLFYERQFVQLVTNRHCALFTNCCRRTTKNNRLNSHIRLS